MGILVLNQRYEHATVFSVKENIQIKKAQGNATYPGTQLNFENASNEAKSAKWQQDWLDNSYQHELKASIQALKAGDKVTLYEEKALDEDKYNAMDAATKKKAGFWSVKKIYQGHVVPVEMADKKSVIAPAATAGRKPVARGKGSNDLGMKVGHSIKGATTLCLRLKKPFMDGAKEVYEVTAELTEYYKARTGQDDYQAGNAAGNAVLNACFMASPNKDIKTIAKKILDEYIPEIEKYIIEQETPAPAPVAEPVQQAESTTADFDDDIPF
jgi:hypothetical protein